VLIRSGFKGFGISERTHLEEKEVIGKQFLFVNIGKILGRSILPK